MAFSESYLFVLVISLFLSIPFAFAIRTLLHTKQRVILPILRLNKTKSLGKPRVEQSYAIDRPSALDRSSIMNRPYPLTQGGNYGDCRSVDGKKLGEY